jgi:hypothetical protein
MFLSEEKMKDWFLGKLFFLVVLVFFPLCAFVCVGERVFADNTTTTVTITGPDITGPVVSGVQKSNLTSSAVTINWSTNENTTSSYIDYGVATTTYDSTTEEVYGARNHQADLSGLNANTVYYFQIRSTDFSNNTSTHNYDNGGSQYSFTTNAVSVSQSGGSVVLPPPPSRIKVGNLEVYINNGANYTNKRDVSVGFTNYDLFSQVKISENENFTDAVFQEILPLTSWQLADKDGRKTLYFQFKTGGGAESEIISRSIILDRVAPSAPVNFKATTTEKSAKLDWLLPSEGDVAGVRIFRSGKGYTPNALSDDEVVFEGKGEQVFDFNVIAGRTYYYTAFAYDYVRNYSSASLASAVIGQVSVNEKPESVSKPETKPGSETDIKDTEKEPVEESVNTEQIVYEREVKKIDVIIPEKTFNIELGDKIVELDATNNQEPIVWSNLFPKNFHYLEKTPITVILDKKYFPEKPTEILLKIDDGFVYGFQEKGQLWEVKFETVAKKEATRLSVEVVYSNKKKEMVNLGELLVDPYGYVYQKVVEPHGHLFTTGFFFWEMVGKENRLKGAEVSLYQFDSKKKEWKLFDGVPYNQQNPQFTNEKGEFGFMVPAGRYYLEAIKSGFGDKKSKAIEIDSGVINQNIEISSTLAPWWKLEENTGLILLMFGSVMVVASIIFKLIYELILRRWMHY